MRALHRIGLWLLLVLVAGRCALADDKEKRKEVVNGILRILIDSQVQRQGLRDERAPLPPPPQAGRATVELIEARQRLEGMQRESAALSNFLQKEAVTNPGARGLLGDTLKFQARVDAVNQRSRLLFDHRALSAEVAQLDREWRILNMKLQQTPRLSAPCRESFGRMDQHHQSLCKLLAVEPTLDRRLLVRYAETLSAHMRSLVEDVAFEARASIHGRELVRDAGLAQQAANAFSDVILDNVPFRVIADRYQAFLRLWEPLNAKLCALESRHVEREVINVQQVDQKIRELMWLPRALNRDLINQLAAGVLKDVDRVFDSVSLSLLMQLPQAAAIPSAASEFYGYCEHFAECARRSDRLDEITDAYDELPAAWVAFSRHFRNVQHAPLQQTLTSIEQRLVALREPLGIPNGLDRDEARRRAAALEHLAEHLNDDVTTWLAGRKVPEGERRSLLDQCAQLRATARTFHALLVQPTPSSELEKLSDSLITQWEALAQRVSASKAPDRDHLLEVLANFGAELVEVEALFLG